jgi:polysaccharide export outer membrane protein
MNMGRILKLGPSRRLRRACAAALLLGLVSAVAWAQQTPAAAAAVSAAAAQSEPAVARGPVIAPQDYLISADDVLDVYVMDVADLSRTYRVSPTGAIKLPLLPEPIIAQGLTPDQLSDTIAAALKANGLVMTPNITVTVKESVAHSVAIAGAVKEPKMYPVFGRMNLLDIISLAGGLEDNAGSMARITRGPIALRNLNLGGPGMKPDANDLSFTVDLRRLLETGDPALNVPIFPGDSVTIPLAGIVYVVGAVNKPGGFVLSTARQGMTVLQALAMAEDTKPTALRDKAIVVRRGAELTTARQEIPVNLKKILQGRAADFSLQANDILFVPDSSSRRAMRKGAEAALQMLTGIVVWRR